MLTRLIYFIKNILGWIFFVYQNVWGNFSRNGWRSKNIQQDMFCIVGGLITGCGLGYVISLLPLLPITNGVLLIILFVFILSYVLSGYGYRKWEFSPYAQIESFTGYLLEFQASVFTGVVLYLLSMS